MADKFCPSGDFPNNAQCFASDERLFAELFRPKGGAEVLYNTCTKFYPDGEGGWLPVKRIVFDRPIYNPTKAERRDKEMFEDRPVTKNRKEDQFWEKSYNRARQQCFDYLMCNPDLDTFLTFTVDPSQHNSHDYSQIVEHLSTWLSNRVRRNGLKYILVPERHRSGAIHFHGIANREGLRLVPSGYWKVGKYTLEYERISKKKRGEAQEIFNVKDLTLGFSTALVIEGENAQEKVSKYIWKYMTKQGGQKIGGRFYLHGGELTGPRLVYSNESFEGSGGSLVSYGSTALKIETLNF
jgi:hypothetical protein